MVMMLPSISPRTILGGVVSVWSGAWFTSASSCAMTRLSSLACNSARYSPSPGTVNSALVWSPETVTWLVP